MLMFGQRLIAPATTVLNPAVFPTLPTEEQSGQKQCFLIEKKMTSRHIESRPTVNYKALSFSFLKDLRVLAFLFCFGLSLVAGWTLTI